MKLHTYPDALQTAEALLKHLLQRCQEKPDTPFHVAFSGGETPTLLFDLWAQQYADHTPWEQLRCYWVDERCVPAEEAQSNYGTMKRHLLDKVPIAPSQIFPILGDNEPTAEATRYATQVIAQLPRWKGLPAFDLVLLGAGDDGHTSSIFPGQTELLTTEAYYAPSRHPVSGQHRVALTAHGILAARQIAFLLTGKRKLPILHDLLSDIDTGPAAYIAHRHSDVHLFTDQGEAANKVSPAHPL